MPIRRQARSTRRPTLAPVGDEDAAEHQARHPPPTPAIRATVSSWPYSTGSPGLGHQWLITPSAGDTTSWRTPRTSTHTEDIANANPVTDREALT